MRDRDAWEEEAERWVRFARTPGHDAYWQYRDRFFEDVMPGPGRPTVEVGCGEGRVTRDLLGRGHRMVGLDGSPTLVRHAATLDPVRRYVVADAGRLPFATASVGVAVSYNSLMDVDDLTTVVAEVGRILVDDGAFCVCITHPLQYAGGFDSDEPDSHFVMREVYFGRHRFDTTVTRDDITFRFRGWTRPLEDYFAALFAAGFVVEALSEPRPATDEGRYARWHRLPMFLLLRAVKHPRRRRR